MERALNIGEVKVFDRVGYLLQVLRRQVQILGGCFQIAVSEQQLDGAQVGACFQQMRGPAVAKGIAVLLMICIPQKSAIRCIRSTESK